MIEGAATVILFGSLFYAAVAIASRLTPLDCAPLVRITTASVVLFAIPIAVFRILAPFSGFRILPALGLVLLLALVGGTPKRVLGILRADFEASCAGFRRWDETSRALAGLSLAAAALFLARAIALPRIGWDSVTYHAVKVGLWLQTGGSLPLETPSAWSVYKRYPDGGEIIGAFAALPTHSELYTGAVEVLAWVLTAAPLAVIARTLGLHPILRMPAVVLALAMPNTVLLLGGGYVEPFLNLFVLSGVALLLVWRETGASGALGVGLVALAGAFAVKFTALPLLAVGGLWVLALLPKAVTRRRGLLALAGAVLAGGVLFGPWLIDRAMESGLPLSPYPVKVAGVELGRALPQTLWYQARPDLLTAGWDRELSALSTVFDLQPTLPKSLGPLAIFLFLAAPIGLLRTHRASLSDRVLVALVAAIPVLAWFSGGFTVVRLGWTESSARFLGPTYSLVAILAFIPMGRVLPDGSTAPASKGTTRAGELLGLLALLQLLIPPLVQIRGFEWAFMAGTFAFLGAAVLIPRILPRGSLRAVVLVSCGLLATPMLQQLADQARPLAFELSGFGTRPPWEPLIWTRSLPIGPLRVAVTCGPNQSAHTELLSPFLGSRFQNTLVHVPLLPDRIVPFDGKSPYPPAGSLEDEWVARVRKEADVVVAFRPKPVEVAWMRKRPWLFEHVAGPVGQEGLYLVVKDADEQISPFARAPRAPP